MQVFLFVFIYVVYIAGLTMAALELIQWYIEFVLNVSHATCFKFLKIAFVLKQVAQIIITDALYSSEKEKRQQTRRVEI